MRSLKDGENGAKHRNKKEKIDKLKVEVEMLKSVNVVYKLAIVNGHGINFFPTFFFIIFCFLMPQYRSFKLDDFAGYIKICFETHTYVNECTYTHTLWHSSIDYYISF